MTKYFSKYKQYALSIIKTYRKKTITPIPMSDNSLQKLNIEYNKQRFYGPQKYFCYAPFGSLFISYSGKVAPCYACNINESMQHKSIEDIWNGKVFQSLRDDFAKGKIPEACSFCRDHFVSEDFGSVLANKYDHYLMSSKGFPVIAELELSNQCNLECIMCTGALSSSIRKNREHLPDVINKIPDDFINQFESILKNLKSLELTGGDPLLIDLYYELLNRIEIINPKIDVLITTNANTFTKQTENLLNKNLKLSFNVSIDSLHEETYSQIRCNGSLKTALKNINHFKKYTQNHNTSLGFLVCPLKQNWKELPDFVAFANKHQASLSYHIVFKPAEHALWSFSSIELQEIVSYLKSFQFSGHNFIENINLRSYNSVVHLIESWLQKAINREKHLVETIQKIEKDIDSAKNNLKGQLSNTNLFDIIELKISKTNISYYPNLIFIALAQKNKEELLEGLNTLNDNELLEKLKLYYSEIYSSYFYALEYSDNDKYHNNRLL